MIPVAELFGPTIQGEGPNVGSKCLFLRVAGCDFRCSWCDSSFAWKVTSDTWRADEEALLAELLSKCAETHTSRVIITGGNPCLYDFTSVIRGLRANNIEVDIETQGSILPEWLTECSTVVISPKAPSSDQPDVYLTVQKWLDEADLNGVQVAIKIPVFDDRDIAFVERYDHLVKKFNSKVNLKLYINVGNTNTTEPGVIADRVLRDYEVLINKVANSSFDNVYVLPQIHTLVWGNKQGV